MGVYISNFEYVNIRRHVIRKVFKKLSESFINIMFKNIICDNLFVY